MARIRVVYRCSECAATHPKWAGQCGTCEAWNSLVEDVEEPDPVGATRLIGGPAARPIRIGEVDALLGRPQPTGIAEFDRVLGGGLVPGSVTLLGGEPGIGKSTLLLQLLASWPGSTLYISAEESAQQVRLRAERLGAVNPELWIVPETSLNHILTAIEQVQPTLVVVDSIQAVADPQVASAPGSVVQVRGCTHLLVGEAKRRNLPMVLVGHVTKDGSLAGPRVLEHVVDTVLNFEGDRHHALRLLRAVKHRFGATHELGVFEMAGHGLVGVPDASSLFLTDRRTGVAGSAITPTLEGQRPLLVEVQALTNPVPPGAPPRRSAQGIDPGRLALLLAVLERRARFQLSSQEVFASAVGGVRLTEPGVDLAVCLAVVSALTNTPLPADVVVFGEVGLAGELRQAAQAPRRLAEAARLGFARAVVPTNSPNGVDGITLIRAGTVSEALAAVGLATGFATNNRITGMRSGQPQN
ncbi:MAG: DNA repair protein RadA [Ilumatobacteraceae bacterium]